MVEGLSIIGDRTGPARQNALVFYDRNDDLRMRDVEVDFVRGRALYSGALKTTVEGYMRESRLEELRFIHDGDSGAPVMEWTATGHGDTVNEIKVIDLHIYAPHSEGLKIAASPDSTGSAAWPS